MFDVTVLGAGVVGSAIARELSKYHLKVAMLEKNADVGAGTSKGNSAIMHTGFDAKPGSLESKLVRRGSQLYRSEVAGSLGLPYEPLGAFLLAYSQDEFSQLPEILKKAKDNGEQEVSQWSKEQILKCEPYLNSKIFGGIKIDREAIVCPFSVPLAYATQAVLNGVQLYLNAEVTAIAQKEMYQELTTSLGVFKTRYIVNAAGLWGDSVDALVGKCDFTMKPRRGQFIVFDKFARRLVKHILLQVPTPRTKGILISPTIFGNVLLGPTAEDIESKTDTHVTHEGLQRILKQSKEVIPELHAEEVTTLYAGIRPATEFSDYQINIHGDVKMVTVGGIRSTGLSSALGIAEYVSEALQELGVNISPQNMKNEFQTFRMPNLSEFQKRPYQCESTIRKKSEYGHLVCYCEKVSKQEILDALQSSIPARTMDGLRRRTRATMGRCQGFYCAPSVTNLLAAHSERRPHEIL